MATSRLLPVVVIGPWRNCWVTAATLTPMPLFWPLAEPTALATASANSAREDLKPVVLALAMLWPITSRFLLAAFRPERPCWNPMVCSCDVFGWMVRGSVHGLDGGVGDVGAVVQLQRQLAVGGACGEHRIDRKSTRLNSSHLVISYAVFCLKKKKKLHCTPTVLLSADVRNT